MNAPDQRWRELPIFRELFLQWRTARAGAELRTRPFFRDWERLLQDAQLTSGELRREADRDARAMAAAGLVEIRAERLRPYQIERISIPLGAEPKIRSIFADELPEPEQPARDLATFPWAPALDFLRQSRTGVAFADLQLLNGWLQRAPTRRDSVPIKERSLEIFGDEKRLDALLLTSLFRADRLTLEHFRCHLVPEPLAWKRGHAPGGPVIVLENAATWESYCRWDERRPRYAALVYGCGNRFRDGVSFLREIFAELGGPREGLYFGDLDVQGIRIPLQASMIARQARLPPIEADLSSYEWLLEHGKPQAYEPNDALLPEDFDWFGRIRQPVQNMVESKQRIAQEAVGWDVLQERE